MTRGSIISDGGRGEFSRGSTQSVFSGLEGSFPRQVILMNRTFERIVKIYGYHVDIYICLVVY